MSTVMHPLYRFLETCDIENNCDPSADCRFDEQLNEYTCVCRSGYNGDGYICTRSRDYPDLCKNNIYFAGEQ